MAGSQSNSKLIGSERRRARRHPAAKVPHVHASILAGPDVKIVDVSPHGLLVESDVRLIPGAGICLTIKFANESHMLGGRVARVDTAVVGNKMKYRAGIALDGLFAPFDLPTPEPSPSEEASTAVAAPEAGAADGSATAPPSTDLETSASGMEALRQTLAEQRRTQQHDVRVIEMLKAALRASEVARKELEEARRRECETWEQERRTFEQALELAARHKERLSAELAASEERTGALAKELEEERVSALARDAVLQEQLQGATGKCEESLQELVALRESHRALSRSLDEERAMLADLLREKDRLIAELEQAGADLDAASRDRDRANDDCRQGEVLRARLAKQLETAERWCADQHELIYQLWQQALRSTSLIEGWKSLQRERGTAAAPAKGAPADVMLPAPITSTPIETSTPDLAPSAVRVSE